MKFEHIKDIEETNRVFFCLVLACARIPCRYICIIIGRKSLVLCNLCKIRCDGLFPSIVGYSKPSTSVIGCSNETTFTKVYIIYYLLTILTLLLRCLVAKESANIFHVPYTWRSEGYIHAAAVMKRRSWPRCSAPSENKIRCVFI